MLANIDSEHGRKRLFAPLPERPFASAPSRGFLGPQWLVTVDTYRAYDLGDHTLELPWIAALNPWASRTMVPAGEVRTTDRGVAA